MTSNRKAEEKTFSFFGLLSARQRRTATEKNTTSFRADCSLCGQQRDTQVLLTSVSVLHITRNTTHVRAWTASKKKKEHHIFQRTLQQHQVVQQRKDETSVSAEGTNRFGFCDPYGVFCSSLRTRKWSRSHDGAPVRGVLFSGAAAASTSSMLR